MDKTLGTWSVRSVYSADSLRTLASELAKHNLDPLAVKQVRWDNGGIQPEDDYTFSMEMGMLIITYIQAFFFCT
jgi:hypothetical protein